MTDLLNMEVPSIETIDAMAKDDISVAYLILLDHFYRSMDEIKTLQTQLRELQVNRHTFKNE